MNSRRYSKFLAGLITSLFLSFLLTNSTLAKSILSIDQKEVTNKVVQKIYTSIGNHDLKVDFSAPISMQPQREAVTRTNNLNNQLVQNNYVNNWQLVSTTHKPSLRAGYGFVWDNIQDKLILFGGTCVGFACGDTWEYDGVDWQQLVINGPSSREDAEMAYDSLRQRVVLFGGHAWADGNFNDTWEFYNNSWEQVLPSTTPLSRSNQAMAYDPIRGKTIMFGGWRNSQTGADILGDTWEYNGDNWYLASTANSPQPRAGARLVYANNWHKFVLFGGHGRNGDLNDTWFYDGLNWNQINTTTSPSPRWDYQMAYDPIRNVVILFGGVSGSSNNETWEFDGTNWYIVSPATNPPSTWDSTAVWYGQRGVFMYGGNSPNQNDLVDTFWRYVAVNSYSLSGDVTDSSSNPISGVSISDGAGHTATTDSSGNYTLSGLEAGTYTIAPSKSGYTFLPASHEVTVPPDGTNQDFTGIPDPGVKAFTLIYYLDGDTTYLNSNSQTDEPLDRDYSIPVFNELRKVASNPNINIVALLDQYGNNNSAYYLVDSTTDPLNPSSLTQNINYWPQGEVNMGDPQTLSNFATWAKANFPADHYALILSDHGSGLGGGMFDITSGNDRLTVMEMGNALSTITNNGTNKIDVLYMDACMMGMLEDAYQFRNYVDYYVASENTKQGYSVPHGQAISSVSVSTTPAELAQQFASTYTAYAAADDKLYTMAVMDMTQTNPVLDATKLLAQRIIGLMPTNYQTLSDILQQVQTFDKNGDGVITPTEGYIDLYDFAVLVKGFYSDPDTKASAQAVMDAVGNFVISEGHQNPGKVWGVGNSHGVAIYFPSRSSSFYSSINYDFAQGVVWSIFGSQELSGPLSSVQADDSISWGNMLVNYINYANPTGEDIPLPPDPVPQTITTYTISGNAGVGGATLNYTGGSTNAEDSGVYSIIVPSDWSGTVTPSMTSYTFSPVSKTYSNVVADKTGENYTATGTAPPPPPPPDIPPAITYRIFLPLVIR